jgi:hypothetical protein
MWNQPKRPGKSLLHFINCLNKPYELFDSSPLSVPPPFLSPTALYTTKNRRAKKIRTDYSGESFYYPE